MRAAARPRCGVPGARRARQQSLRAGRSGLGGAQVVETASGMLPQEEQRFMAQRAAAASIAVSDAFRLEVSACPRRPSVRAWLRARRPRLTRRTG